MEVTTGLPVVPWGPLRRRSSCVKRPRAPSDPQARPSYESQRSRSTAPEESWSAVRVGRWSHVVASTTQSVYSSRSSPLTAMSPHWYVRVGLP